MVSERNRAFSSWVDCRHALATRWPLIVLGTSLAMLAGAFLGSRETPQFVATAIVSLSESEHRPIGPYASSAPRPVVASARNRREATLRGGVLMLSVVDSEELQERWGIESRVEALRELRSRVRVSEAEPTGLYRISVRGAGPGEAVRLANAIASEFIDGETAKARLTAEGRVRSFATEIESRSRRIAEIEEELVATGSSGEGEEGIDPVVARDLRRRLVNESNILRSLEAKHQRAVVELQEISSPGVALVQEASEEETALARSRWYLARVGSLLGFGLSTGLVLLFSAGRSPFSVLAKISEAFPVPVLGVAPLPRRPLPSLRAPSDSVVEPYRDLRTRIHRLPAAECSVIGLVPEDASANTAAVAVNLASVLADGGHTVLLIDADLRNPGVHDLFDAGCQPGLADYLSGEMRIQETVFKTRHSNLWCMPSGRSMEDPGRFLGGKRMEDFLWEMKSRFDYILLTAPSTQTHADAGVIGGYTDHLLVVAPYARHSLSRLRKVRYALEHSGATVSGVIVAFSVDERRDRESLPPSPQHRRASRVPAVASRTQGRRSTRESR